MQDPLELLVLVPWDINTSPDQCVFHNVSVSSVEWVSCRNIIIPSAPKSCWGYIGFTPSVCPSVSTFVRPSFQHSVSTLYCLQFWLDPFHILTSYQATSEGVSHVKFLAKFQHLDFWQFFWICNFDFVLFWLGIWCESLVWVIMGRYLRTQAF